MRLSKTLYYPAAWFTVFLLSACGPEAILPSTTVEAEFYMLPDSSPAKDLNILCFMNRMEIKNSKSNKEGKVLWNNLEADSLSDLAWCIADRFYVAEPPLKEPLSWQTYQINEIKYYQPLEGIYSLSGSGLTSENGTSKEVILQRGLMPLPNIIKFTKNKFKIYVQPVADVEIEFRFSDDAAALNDQVLIYSENIKTTGMESYIPYFYLPNSGGKLVLRNFPINKTTEYRFSYDRGTIGGAVRRFVNLSLQPEQTGITKKYQVLID
jgi:hypothetical protein